MRMTPEQARRILEVADRGEQVTVDETELLEDVDGLPLSVGETDTTTGRLLLPPAYREVLERRAAGEDLSDDDIRAIYRRHRDEANG